jgi:hypothetical protein
MKLFVNEENLLQLKIARHLKIANRKTEFGIVSITPCIEISWKFFAASSPNMKLISGIFFSQSKSCIY